MRRFLQISFFFFLIVSLILGVIAFRGNKWETLTAALALIIAIISAWVAYETFYRQSEQENPQIVISFDTLSRYGLLLLCIKNYGNRPAFNIEINWDIPVQNANRQNVSFNSTSNENVITVLNKGENLARIVDSTIRFFKVYKDEDLNYKGTVIYTMSLQSKKKYSIPFILSLNGYKDTIFYEIEEPKTHFELQKIPGFLDKIYSELRQMRLYKNSVSEEQQNDNQDGLA